MLAEDHSVTSLTVTLPGTGCHSASLWPSATEQW